MKKLFRKILASIFVVGMSFFINSVLATNYKVNIAVVGNQQKGKTQIIRRIVGLPFQKVSPKSSWDQGVYGRQKVYQIDGDTFECNYYDAPGYLQNERANIDQQINSKAIQIANIALIVVDPKQKEGIDPAYTNSIHEALQRHTFNVRKVNPKCKIIVVANRIDEIDPQELVKYRSMLEGARMLYSEHEADGVFTSAATDAGIPELEGMIVNLMRLNKASFSTFDSSFIVCKYDGREQRRDRCVEGYKKDLYCSEGCLIQAEGETCAYDSCTDKERFLRVKNQGFVSPHTDKLYCSRSHYVQNEGDYCQYGPCHTKFVVADHTGFITSSETGKRYCSRSHYVQNEGDCCQYGPCCTKFVVADHTGFVTSSKTGKRYCCEDHREKEEKKDWCMIM